MTAHGEPQDVSKFPLLEFSVEATPQLKTENGAFTEVKTPPPALVNGYRSSGIGRKVDIGICFAFDVVAAGMFGGIKAGVGALEQFVGGFAGPVTGHAQ